MKLSNALDAVMALTLIERNDDGFMFCDDAVEGNSLLRAAIGSYRIRNHGDAMVLWRSTSA